MVNIKVINITLPKCNNFVSLFKNNISCIPNSHLFVPLKCFVVFIGKVIYDCVTSYVMGDIVQHEKDSLS